MPESLRDRRVPPAIEARKIQNQEKKKNTARAVSEGFGLCVLFDIVKRK
jgi:hypothetical protein